AGLPARAEHDRPGPRPGRSFDIGEAAALARVLITLGTRGDAGAAAVDARAVRPSRPGRPGRSGPGRAPRGRAGPEHGGALGDPAHARLAGPGRAAGVVQPRAVHAAGPPGQDRVPGRRAAGDRAP